MFSGVVSTTIYLVMSVMILFSRGKLNRSGSPRLEEGSTKIFNEPLSPVVAEKDLITFPQEFVNVMTAAPTLTHIFFPGNPKIVADEQLIFVSSHLQRNIYL